MASIQAKTASSFLAFLQVELYVPLCTYTLPSYQNLAHPTSFMLVVEPRYLKHVADIAPLPVKPEKRLELAVICSWCLVVSMFWFAWTSGPSITWVSPLLAMVLLGIAMLGLFVSL